MLVVMLVLAFLFLRVHRSLHDAAFTRAVHRKPQTRAATFDTLSLTDRGRYLRLTFFAIRGFIIAVLDRKSTRLNSSHQIISYAVFCLKKKNRNRLSQERHVGDYPS